MNRILLKAPQRLKTELQLPASKSICNRALIINALAGGKGELSNLSDCDDTRVMVEALRDMPALIDIGAAGTAMRFLTAYLSTRSSVYVLTGTERMRHRPIQILVEALRSLGATIDYEENDGFPPLRIAGKTLSGGTVTMKGNVSSQYISALLLIAPTLRQGLILHLTDKIISRSYINMTLQLMREFGADAGWKTDDRIEVKPTGYRDIPYAMESDWSAASYWYEMVALSADSLVRLGCLRHDSFQGDSRIAAVFEKLGVHTQYEGDRILLTKSTTVIANRFEDDFSDIPDMAQTVVVTCALLGVHFRITGLQTLKIKETDRISALEKELRKLGYVLKDEEEGSVLSWEGECGDLDDCPCIDTYEDHRMAMAFAPAAIRFGRIRVNHPQVVSKSYVNFWNDLQTSGFLLEECDE